MFLLLIVFLLLARAKLLKMDSFLASELACVMHTLKWRFWQRFEIFPTKKQGICDVVCSFGAIILFAFIIYQFF